MTDSYIRGISFVSRSIPGDASLYNRYVHAFNSVEDESCEFSSVDMGSSLEVRSAETEFSIVRLLWAQQHLHM